jgi:hypothetical protein
MMTIRMRHNHAQQRVVEASVNTHGLGWFWWVCGPLDGERLMYSEKEWELVPEERWTPVGAWCIEDNGKRLTLFSQEFCIRFPKDLRIECVLNAPGTFVIRERLK